MRTIAVNYVKNAQMNKHEDLLKSSGFESNQHGDVIVWRRPNKYKTFISYSIDRQDKMRIFNDSLRFVGHINSTEQLKTVLECLKILT